MSFKKIENNGTVILTKFNGEFQVPDYANDEWKNANSEHLRKAVVIDLETTGLEPGQSKIIEIGLRPFQFDRRSGTMIEVGAAYTGLEDPQEPLSQTIVELTGLTDELLKDQKIDWERVGQILEGADVIIAHKADFERSFIDRKFAFSAEKIWACSLSQINWEMKGFRIRKLEVLSIYHGFFTDFHRAMKDVDVLVHLLSFMDDSTQKSYLSELLTVAKQPTVKICADGAPFESKDLLKTRGYRWNTKARVWSKAFTLQSSEEEIEWLEKNVYLGPFRGNTQTLRPWDHFKT